jgi:hypothetical protein
MDELRELHEELQNKRIIASSVQVDRETDDVTGVTLVLDKSYVQFIADGKGRINWIISER